MSLLLTLFCVGGLVAQGSEQAASASKTTRQTAVDPDVLQMMLLPLTLDETRVETDGWMALVQESSQMIIDNELRLREATSAQLDEEDRSRYRRETAAESLRRRALLERFRVAIDAFEAKGGKEVDVALYRKYAAAVAGQPDASAIWGLIVRWVQSPSGGVMWAFKLLLFLGTLLAFRIIARIVGKVVSRALSGFAGASDLLRDFFVNTSRRIVFFIGIVLALSVLGMDIGPFLAAIGAAGFVIGFALQGTLGNFASGIMILLYRPYDIGDYVQLAGVSGTVEAMTLVSTSVRSPDNQTIVVPNSSIWGGIITNVTGKDTRRVDLMFSAGYSDDLVKAEEVLRRIVVEHPLVLPEPEPVIKLHELADSSVNFIVRPWSKTGDYWAVYWDITRAVKEQFDAAGVSIPFPQQDVHVHQVSHA